MRLYVVFPSELIIQFLFIYFLRFETPFRIATTVTLCLQLNSCARASSSNAKTEAYLPRIPLNVNSALKMLPSLMDRLVSSLCSLNDTWMAKVFHRSGRQKGDLASQQVIMTYHFFVRFRDLQFAKRRDPIQNNRIWCQKITPEYIWCQWVHHIAFIALSGVSEVQIWWFIAS